MKFPAVEKNSGSVLDEAVVVFAVKGEMNPVMMSVPVLVSELSGLREVAVMRIAKVV